MKFIVLTVFVCFAILLACVSAKPVEEAIPEGIEGAGSDYADPLGDQPILLKLKLLKKLLFLG